MYHSFSVRLRSSNNVVVGCDFYRRCMHRSMSICTGSSLSSSTTTMKSDAYASAGKNQYAIHHLTRDTLGASMSRLAERCKAEDQNSLIDGSPIRRKRIVDLGSADGSSTMETLQFAIHALNSSDSGNSTRSSSPIPVHITFEKHPHSDKAKLQDTVDMHNDWFQANDVQRDIKMKSFYKPLFPPESIDFLMSYICLHWLDTTDVDKSIVEWKSIGSNMVKDDTAHLLEWTQVNEISAPLHVREEWKRKLAHNHLAKFLVMRSAEMRPGAEMLLVMVGHPHEFMIPSDGLPGPLTRAMKRCISRGELREEVLRNTIIPYFLRTPEDIQSALKLGEKFEGSGTRLLQLIDCKSISTVTRGEEDDNIVQGAFDLFWGIHSHAVESAKPTEDELSSIHAETRRVFDDVYDAKVGVPGSFVVCLLRRRTRERAS